MRILSLDGGGIRGVITARLLERIEKACPGFLDHVDVIAGASTGGIQALKLASGGKVGDLVGLYKNRGADIFKARDFLDVFPKKLRALLLVLALCSSAVLLALGLKAAAGITLVSFLSLVVLLHVGSRLDEFFRSDFSADDMEQVLKDELGTDKTLRDLDKIILIPTFDMREWNTKFFDTFPGDERDLDQYLWEVARCTSAAPTYWPSHQWCLDGGLFANNPSDSAVSASLRYLRKKHLAEDEDLNDPASLYAMRDSLERVLGRQVLSTDEVAKVVANARSMGQITVLSLGTGDVPHKAPKSPRHDAGILGVIPMLLNVVMDGAVKASAFKTSQALNGRHVRVQPRLPGVIDLADVAAIPDLIQIADHVVIEPAVQLIRKHWLPQEEAA
jgi:predicted acylesterase/phospholipase RssA